MDVVYDLRIVEDDRALAHDVAECLIGCAAEAREGVYRIALSGGSTPRQLYGRLASAACRTRIDWSRVEFYFGDERCVPPTHPESNFKLAKESLFDPLGIDPSRIFRMEGEAGQPDLAAERYESAIRRQFQLLPPAWPRFDLILLGLGDDGHTASLFPDSRALHETSRSVVASESPRGIRRRLTLTAPLINHARYCIFMAAGIGKAAAVRTVLQDDSAEAHRYPAKLIHPTDGRLIWYLDRAAASHLAGNTEHRK